MRPPQCSYCKTAFRHDPKSGRLLRFALSPEDEAFNQNMREKDHVGHPRGAYWFCKDHYELAQTYMHLHITEALALIEQVKIDEV